MSGGLLCDAYRVGRDGLLGLAGQSRHLACVRCDDHPSPMALHEALLVPQARQRHAVDDESRARHRFEQVARQLLRSGFVRQSRSDQGCVDA
jgi:hypothetical protein